VSDSARPLIYIAGPFRADTPWEIEQNVRRAEECGFMVAKMDGIPVIPHAMYRFYQDSLPDAFWLEAGLAVLRTCDAVAVCATQLAAEKSVGTTGEIAEAKARGLCVFYVAHSHGAIDLHGWILSWIKEHRK